MKQQVKIELGGTDYRCTINDGQQTWLMDEPVEVGGGGAGPEPYSTLLASLGACSAITLRMYAQRKGWDLGTITVTISLEQVEQDGERQSNFHRDVRFSAVLSDEQRLRLHQIVRACPVSRVLESRIRIDTTTSGA